MEAGVELGFVDEVDDRKLKSTYFPSKFGGKPAWLSWDPLPTTAEIACRKCSKPCAFVLQIYAPSTSSLVAFHRSLFLFACLQETCNQQNSAPNFRIFRSQLPRANQFYKFEAPNYDLLDEETVEPMPNEKLVCIVCGLPSSKCCSKCNSVRYCSVDHQRIHWKSEHKEQCGAENSSVMALEFKYPAALFPQYEIVMDIEDTFDDKELDDEVNELEINNEIDDQEVEAIAEEQQNKIDKIFLKFRKIMRNQPDQILRYQRNGSPLWISRANQASASDVPVCSVCGSARTFECQVLPQLLNYMKVDKFTTSLDWGILALYTCSKDCDIGTKYVEEFIWKQDIE